MRLVHFIWKTVKANFNISKAIPAQDQLAQQVYYWSKPPQWSRKSGYKRTDQKLELLHLQTEFMVCYAASSQNMHHWNKRIGLNFSWPFRDCILSYISWRGTWIASWTHADISRYIHINLTMKRNSYKNDSPKRRWQMLGERNTTKHKKSPVHRQNVESPTYLWAKNAQETIQTDLDLPWREVITNAQRQPQRNQK